MRIFIALFLVGLCTACAPGASGDDHGPDWFRVQVISESGPQAFTVEIADSPEEQQRGLMFRREMAADVGMLFLYGREEDLSYWMHNTYISLDIIYINAEGRIVSIQRNATPLSDESLPSYYPAIAVLEINGGLSDELGISEGDEVRHPFFTELQRGG